MKDVLKMAGHAAAHAIWSISEGETLIPILSNLKDNGQTTMSRFMMGSAEAMAAGNKKAKEFEPDDKGTAFIFDGYAHLDSGRVDSLIIDVNFAPDSQKSLRYMIPYRHATHKDGFAVHRLKICNVSGFSASDAQQISDSFFDGLESHQQGNKIWVENYVDQPGATATDDESGKFSSQDYQALISAPYLIFILVAAADGKVDDKEIKEFIKLLTNPGTLENPLLHKVITSTIGSAGEYLTQVLSRSDDYIQELEKLKRIVDDNLPDSEAREFKMALLQLGKQIAAASGGFFGFGNKISKQKKMALAAIAICLDIQPS